VRPSPHITQASRPAHLGPQRSDGQSAKSTSDVTKVLNKSE
jgi:hypothetical protein